MFWLGRGVDRLNPSVRHHSNASLQAMVGDE